MSWTLKQLGAQVDDVVDEMDTDVDDFRVFWSNQAFLAGSRGRVVGSHTLRDGRSSPRPLARGPQCEGGALDSLKPHDVLSGVSKR